LDSTSEGRWADRAYINAVEVINHLPKDILLNMAYYESSFRTCPTSPAGAVGLFQFMPDTAAAMGLDDPCDPEEATKAAGKYLRRLLDTKGIDGDIVKAVAAYNWGVSNVIKRGLQEAPKETKDYVFNILGISLP